MDGTRLGRTAAYRRAREVALAWQQSFPMKNGAWTACCEDVPIDNSIDNYNAVEPMCESTDSWKTARWLVGAHAADRVTVHCRCSVAALTSIDAARYLIEQRVPGWQADAESLLKFVEQHLIFNNISNEPAIQYGARAVSEQKEDHNKMGCHTARYAHILAMYNEAVCESSKPQQGLRSTVSLSGVYPSQIKNAAAHPDPLIGSVCAVGGGRRSADDGKNASLTDISFRSYNWASYMVLTSGLVVVGPAARYVRHDSTRLHNIKCCFCCGIYTFKHWVYIYIYKPNVKILCLHLDVFIFFARRCETATTCGSGSSCLRSWTCCGRCDICRIGSRSRTICSSFPAHRRLLATRPRQ